MWFVINRFRQFVQLPLWEGFGVQGSGFRVRGLGKTRAADEITSVIEHSALSTQHSAFSATTPNPPSTRPNQLLIRDPHRLSHVSDVTEESDAVIVITGGRFDARNVQPPVGVEAAHHR